MSSLITVLLVLKAAAFVAVSSKEINAILAQEFFSHLEEAFDFNGDKIVVPSEISYGLLKHDRNQDKKLEKSEFDVYLGRHNEALLEISDEMFDLIDLNQNEFIDEEDLALLYSAVDGDGDNKIDEEEFKGVAEALSNNAAKEEVPL